MAQPKPDPNPAPDPAPAPAPTADEPEWATNLRRMVEELPGKLRAHVSDDDKRGIAESVHGLFEQSGAFKDPDPPPAGEPGGSDPPAPNADPVPVAERESWARRLFGPH